jgi:hypothetical protein
MRVRVTPVQLELFDAKAGLLHRPAVFVPGTKVYTGAGREMKHLDGKPFLEGAPTPLPGRPVRHFLYNKITVRP